jgi:hypothetical protein
MIQLDVDALRGCPEHPRHRRQHTKASALGEGHITRRNPIAATRGSVTSVKANPYPRSLQDRPSCHFAAALQSRSSIRSFDRPIKPASASCTDLWRLLDEYCPLSSKFRRRNTPCLHEICSNVALPAVEQTGRTDTFAACRTDSDTVSKTVRPGNSRTTATERLVAQPARNARTTPASSRPLLPLHRNSRY